MPHVQIESEIGPLQTVIVHRPGHEVELMHPQSAHDVLFDDILFLPRAAAEHDQFTATLRQFADVLEVETLLCEVLDRPDARAELLDALCTLYGCPSLRLPLAELPSDQLARQVLIGTPARLGPLASFLRADRFALPPMPNFYFTRDAAMCVYGRVLTGAMNSRARRGEACVMRTLFRYHPALASDGFYVDGADAHPPELTIEGGDLLVLRDDLLLVGQSERTSVAGIDALVEQLAEEEKQRWVIVQEIPRARPYIHFDMVFTLLDRDLCMIHEPVIRGPATQAPLLIEVGGGRTPRVSRHPDLLALLAELGMPLTTVVTGGSEPLRQAREQWHKGTNFFAMAPGKIVGYTRNEGTERALVEHGFRLVRGEAVQAGEEDLTGPGRVAVLVQGTELSRGGGGCRCMTLPVRRAPVG